MASVSSAASSTGSSNGAPMDPVVRNALRYSLSPREYQLLHKYLIARAPAVKKRAPPPARYERAVSSADDYNAAAIRVSLRVFATSFAGLKLWELISTKILARGKALPYVVALL
jgi:hypothetical protein